MKNKNSKIGFILCIVILISGMTIGLFLLSLVYDGPMLVKLIVFIIYLLIVYYLVKFSKKFIDAMYSDGQK